MEQAIGVIPGPEGGVTLLVKKSDKHHQPATSTQTTAFGPQRSTRKYVYTEPLPCKRSTRPRNPTPFR
jgi:large subunit ribosomal protein L28e